jgi:hypothetical protein
VSAPSFLPWLRQGLARGIGGRDPRSGPLALRAALHCSVTLEDSLGASRTATSPLAILGPGDVTGIDATQVVRREPVPGTVDADPSLLPALELAAPDLPWLLTPAAPDRRAALRPWIVLVCVEERAGVVYDATGPTGPMLRIGGDAVAVELPDLADAWAWAHVQAMVAAEAVEASVAAADGAVLARLLAPRRLVPARTYRAALVPAFVAGDDELVPAWDVDAPADPVELAVYDTWTFSTARQQVSFEALCRRLQPDDTSVRSGFHDAEIVDRGLLAPFGGDTGFEYEGALVDAGASGRGLSPDAREWLNTELGRRLEESALRQVIEADAPEGYDPATDDPVVGPPEYGSWAAGSPTLPAEGWLHDVNLRPDRRTPAGLGARVVREHDDELLAAAWDQAGDVRALRESANRARLAAEIGRSHARRLATLSDAPLLQVTSRLQVFVPAPGGTLVEQIAGSAPVPSGVVSAALQRQARRGGVLARRALADRSGAKAPAARVAARFVDGSAPAEERVPQLEACASFGASFQRPDAVATTTVFRLPAGSAGGPADAGPVPNTPVAPIQSAARDDLRGAATLVRAALDPMADVVAGLQARLSGVALDPAADLSTRIVIGPRFPDALFPWLVEFGAELVLPGVGDMPDDRVRLVEANEGWVAAFLVGANHQWAREALWNEYPADLAATAFSTFWPHVPAGVADLDADVHEWPAGSALRSHVGSGGSSTVLLVRGEVVRRFRGLELFLVTPLDDGGLVEADGSIPQERTTWPAFTGTLDAATVFAGFEVDARVVREEGRYVAIQEPVTGPRFGFDVAGAVFGEAPATWADLSWGHVTRSESALAALGNVRLVDAPWLDDVTRDDITWGRNGAHMAGITFQQPFRLLLPATYLLPEPGP